MEEITKDLLESFLQRVQENPGPVPYSVSFVGQKHNRSLYICSAIHGDEVGSIPAILRIIDEMKSGQLNFGGKLTLSLGNVEAIKINKRFVTEDMNRIFGKKDLSTVDAKRAQEIATLITSHDVFVDLHQTIGPTKSPFYVIRGSEENIQLSRIVAAAPIAIVVDDEELHTTDKVTGTAFANQHNVNAFTLELSQKGYSKKSEDLAYSAIKSVITLVDTYSHSSWQNLAKTAPPLALIKVQHSERFVTANMKLVPGLINGEYYHKDFVLGYREDQPIRAPFDGYIFFPKYPERDQNGNAVDPRPSHLFEFGKAIK